MLKLTGVGSQPLMVYWVPCAQRFLSYMAFSVNEVVRVACQLRSWFVYAP